MIQRCPTQRLGKKERRKSPRKKKKEKTKERRDRTASFTGQSQSGEANRPDRGPLQALCERRASFRWQKKHKGASGPDSPSRQFAAGTGFSEEKGGGRPRFPGKKADRLAVSNGKRDLCDGDKGARAPPSCRPPRTRKREISQSKHILSLWKRPEEEAMCSWISS